jgi:hypothetical protein
MSLMQVQSKPDQIVAGIKWERVKIQVDDQFEDADRAIIHPFIIVVWSDAVWFVEEQDVNDETLNRVVIEGKSLSFEDARRDATLALLGACGSAHFFLYSTQAKSSEGIRSLIDICDETARIIRDSAINLTPED